MKIRKIVRLIIPCYLLLAAGALYAANPKIEIHHVGVGQGDGTVIYIEDENDKSQLQKIVIVIDAGNSKGKGVLMAKYVQDSMLSSTNGGRGASGVYAVIVSHLHVDHYGGAIEMINQFKNKGTKVSYFVDRSGFSTLYNTSDTDSPECYTYEDSEDTYDNPTGKRYSSYVTAIQQYQSKVGGSKRVSVGFGTNILSSYNLKHTVMYCFASNGTVNGTSFLQGASGQPRDENDLSFAWVVAQNTFRYFSAGDIGAGSPYSDGETPIAAFFKDNFNYTDCGMHYCVLKASHHGSSHSSSENFLGVMKPTITVIPSALRSFSGTSLPTQETGDRLKTASRDTVLFTFIPNNTSTWSQYFKTSNCKYYNDVILKVDNPQEEHDISITLITRSRKKSGDLAYNAGAIVTSLTCTQTHKTCTSVSEESAVADSDAVTTADLTATRSSSGKKSADSANSPYTF